MSERDPIADEPKPVRVVVQPRFCPLCGEETEVVRHITGNVFELMCDLGCGKPSVILSNDHAIF